MPMKPTFEYCPPGMGLDAWLAVYVFGAPGIGLQNALDFAVLHPELEPVVVQHWVPGPNDGKDGYKSWVRGNWELDWRERG